MSHEGFDPSPEQQDEVLIDAAGLHKTQRMNRWLRSV